MVEGGGLGVWSGVQWWWRRREDTSDSFTWFFSLFFFVQPLVSSLKHMDRDCWRRGGKKRGEEKEGRSGKEKETRRTWKNIKKKIKSKWDNRERKRRNNKNGVCKADTRHRKRNKNKSMIRQKTREEEEMRRKGLISSLSFWPFKCLETGQLTTHSLCHHHYCHTFSVANVAPHAESRSSWKEAHPVPQREKSLREGEGE